MKPQSTAILLCTLLLSCLGKALLADDDTIGNFLHCLHLQYNNISISEVIYTQKNTSYSSILNFSKQNLLFLGASCRKPLVIVTPFHISQIQAVLKCSPEHGGLQIKVRSGGHDHEGLSYCSDVPFVMIDLINLSSIDVDAGEKTAWVQAGVVLGQLYYRAAEKNLGFPAGMCPTVGVGGHLSGGGYGFMLRKFGLAADHVVDAHLIDGKGRVLDRKSMGEDLFWAIRGGGGASFGIIVAWKVKLVTVPSTVTVFRVVRTLEQNDTSIFTKYQYIAHKLPDDLVITANFGVEPNSSNNARGKMTIIIRASFQSLFLGRVDRLLPLMEERFPELGLAKEDCIEMSWLESVIYLKDFETTTTETYNVEELLDRRYAKNFMKERSDYLQEPVPEKVLEGIPDLLKGGGGGGHNIQLVFFPYGGKMSEISESTIPFPHRAGNLFHLSYLAEWNEEEESQSVIKLITKIYNYMTPYVSKNPRATYVNCRDLEIGRNNEGGSCTSVEKASIWGNKYFKNNFYRLVDVKTMVDPGNFFRYEQSIPPHSPCSREVQSLDIM